MSSHYNANIFAASTNPVNAPRAGLTTLALLDN